MISAIAYGLCAQMILVLILKAHSTYIVFPGQQFF